MQYSRIRPLARKSDLTVEDFPAEMVVYDHKRHRIHCLNRSTSFIWQRCDGRTEMEEIASHLPKAGLPADTEIVRQALKALDRAHLLEGEPVFFDLGLPSRRQLVKRLGLTAASSAALLPAITSAVAPTPVMAASADRHGNVQPPPPPPKPKKHGRNG
jgi:hypothetical protein